MKELKEFLKNEGFSVNCQTCVRELDNIIQIVNFQKRADGIINTNLGVILKRKSNVDFKYKNCDFGWIYWTSRLGESTNEKANNILNWFEERNTLEKIASKFKEKNLSDWTTSNLEKLLK